MERQHNLRPEWWDPKKVKEKPMVKENETREKDLWNLIFSQEKNKTSGEKSPNTKDEAPQCEWILRNGKNKNTRCRVWAENGKFCRNHKVCENGTDNKARRKELYMQKQKAREREGLIPTRKEEDKQLQEAVERSLSDISVGRSLKEYNEITRNLVYYTKLENYFSNMEGWKADHQVLENYFESVEEKMEKESSTTSQ